MVEVEKVGLEVGSWNAEFGKKMKEGRWKDRGWEIERMGNLERQYRKIDGSYGQQN